MAERPGRARRRVARRRDAHNRHPRRHVRSDPLRTSALRLGGARGAGSRARPPDSGGRSAAPRRADCVAGAAPGDDSTGVRRISGTRRRRPRGGARRARATPSTRSNRCTSRIAGVLWRCCWASTRSWASPAGIAGSRLFTLAHLVVVERPGTAFDPDALAPQLRAQWERRLTTDPSRLSRQLAGAIVRVPVAPQPISASAIRAALARGAAGRAEVAGLLPPAVLAYIDRNQLYRSTTDAP